jgi:elongation factor Ts
MAEITAQLVKELREITGAGMMDCKRALSEASGDIETAIENLRKKGLKDLGKRAGKVAAEGLVHSYIHAGGRIGVILELNCETDFVARGEEFTALANTIAMHVAWSNPRFLNRESVDPAVLEKEKEIYLGQLTEPQKKVADKIISGKVDKFYQENCLLEQLDARDPTAKQSIGDLINALSLKVGEKVELKRFARFEVGEGVEKQAVDYAEEVQAVQNSVN